MYKTVKDVIHLVGLLEERSLWIDCLGIVQDKKRFKSHQISGMVDKFASVKLIIFARDG